MPKFLCKCGHVINLSSGWSNEEFMLVPQGDIEKLGDSIDAKKIDASDKAYEILDSSGKTTYICPSCNRLYIEDGVNVFTSYVKENP